MEVKSVEGISILSVFSRSVDSNWTVAIGIPTQILTNQLLHTVWWIVAGTVALLVSSLALAWVIGSKIARPVHELTAPALALGSGSAVIVPSLNLREADEVGRALTRASAMLAAAQHQASHDVLTGLANRALFDEILGHQLAICKRTKTNLAVVNIDLDGFKPVNDAHGHATGDEMLCIVASSIEGRDPRVRFGGPTWRRRICAHFAECGIASCPDGGAEADRQSFRALFDWLADVEDIGEHRHCRVPGVGSHRRGAFAVCRRSHVQSQGRRQARRGARELTHAAGSPSRKPHPSWVSASHSSQPDRGRSPRNLLIVEGCSTKSSGNHMAVQTTMQQSRLTAIGTSCRRPIVGSPTVVWGPK